MKRDADGNLVQQLKKPPGRPAKIYPGMSQCLETVLKKVKIEKAYAKFFRPSYEWNILNLGRPKSKAIN